MSPLQHPDGVNAASALETFAHRVVSIHQKKASDHRGRRVEDSVDIPLAEPDPALGLDAAPSRSGGLVRRMLDFFR